MCAVSLKSSTSSIIPTTIPQRLTTDDGSCIALIRPASVLRVAVVGAAEEAAAGLDVRMLPG
jgi:hypothetical protein